jgi:murein DD-endopeptidase MepM/ murein hydrolase activator NlpD
LGHEGESSEEVKLGQGGEAFPVPSSLIHNLMPVGGNDHDPIPFNAEAFDPDSCDFGQISDELDSIIKKFQRYEEELAHTPSISPVDPEKAWISSGYGLRSSPFTGKQQFHLGIDLAGWKGIPIMATANGKVVFSGRRGPFGVTVEIRHNKEFKTTYGHLLKVTTKKGRYVERGEIIGYMGNSGRSTGYHLHYSIKRNGKHKNPFPYMTDWPKREWLVAEGEGKGNQAEHRKSHESGRSK